MPSFVHSCVSLVIYLQALEGEYPESMGISLFPHLPPWRSEAVTEVRRV